MIVFEKGGRVRNIGMGNDHLYIRNITRVAPGVFRFHVKEDYLPAFKGVAVGNWVSYGFNKANLPTAAVAAKDHSACTYAQIAANRVENITFEDIDIFGSLNGGIRVSDMHGDVTLRDVRVVHKPDTRNLLSTISDALHLMNIRGKLTLEGCEVEALRGSGGGQRILKLFWDGNTDDPAYRLTTDWGAVDGYHAPGRNPGNVFPSAKPAAWTLDDVESPRNSGWFLCALAARRALTFLEHQAVEAHSCRTLEAETWQPGKP